MPVYALRPLPPANMFRQSVLEFEYKRKIVKADYLLEGIAQQPL